MILFGGLYWETTLYLYMYVYIYIYIYIYGTFLKVPQLHLRLRCRNALFLRGETCVMSGETEATQCLYSILGFFWDNGKENGNYYSMLGLYSDNAKENGNYYYME